MRLSLRRLRRLERRHALWLAAVLLLLTVAPVWVVFLLRDEEPPPLEQPLPQVADLDGDGRADPTAAAYRRAAEAFEEGDLDTARRVLRELARERPDESAQARTLIGLYAYQSGYPDAAVEALADSGAVGGALEDWRLYALADAAQATGRPDVAERSLDELLSTHPESPLRGRAYLEAAQVAWTRHDADGALRYLADARSHRLTHRVAAESDRLAWAIGRATGDRRVMREAAKRLLIHSPPVARELRVGDIFRDAQGRILSWEGVLTAEEVEERARSWVELEDGRAARVTLETMPERQRDLPWHLLMAEALTLEHRGAEALQVLADVRPARPAERAALEWQRARATAEMAAVRRGRKNLPVARREALFEESQRHLAAVVSAGGDRELSIEALRQLYGYLAEQGLFDQAVEKLRLLRRLDPTDRTGAGRLWEQGWKEYRQGNFSGAVGYWTQLEDLYPRDRETRRARYWKARAFDELGEHRRAVEGYREIVAESDAADFYYGRAAARLGGEAEPPEATARSVDNPWEIDPRLDRPLRLTDLGLTSLARTELKLAADDGDLDQRDLMALDGVLRVREGDQREGVRLLRGAYPELSGPYQAEVPGPVLGAYYPFLYRDVIEKEAAVTRLPPHLVAGIIRQESAFDARAESWVGARGLMQLMPATAKEVAGRLGQVYKPSRLFDPDFSVLLGTTYFRQTLDRFDGNVELALAGYNGGPNRIRRLWKEAGPNPELDYFLETLKVSESQDYVKRILLLADSYRQLYWNDRDLDVVASTGGA